MNNSNIKSIYPLYVTPTQTTPIDNNWLSNFQSVNRLGKQIALNHLLEEQLKKHLTDMQATRQLSQFRRRYSRYVNDTSLTPSFDFITTRERDLIKLARKENNAVVMDCYEKFIMMAEIVHGHDIKE